MLFRSVLDAPRPDAATDFVKDFQLNLYQDEIYVFTPNGELKTLPNGASCIDFAFEIHSEIGERSIAAKVNGKMVPLRQKLKSGDQVEIVTGNKVNLNPDWMGDVVTHKAKARLRQFIKQKERKVANEGREIWEKRALKGKVEITDQELTKVSKRFKFNDAQEMFYEIGTGAFEVNELFKVVKQLKSKGRLEKDDEDEEYKKQQGAAIPDEYYSSARSVGDGNALLVEGELDHVKYSYANCCSPIPGDNVIGFLSRNGDVKIHRSNCKNAHHLIRTDSERIIDVTWARNIDNQFLGAIKVVGEDRVGLVNDITEVLSKSLQTNMKSINVNSEGGMFEGIITAYVKDLKHLEKIVKRLERIDSIKNVMRYD